MIIEPFPNDLFKTTFSWLSELIVHFLQIPYLSLFFLRIFIGTQPTYYNYKW